MSYSTFDRLVHRIAFASPSVQLAAADIEDTLFKARFAHKQADRPIFVTSLPRAGTTLTLEVLTRSASTATSTYRDMPFVLAPILWSLVSSGRRKSMELRERAHGDGLKINYDSPEAFEEVFWKAHWAQAFQGERLPIWTADMARDDASDFLKTYMRKVISLRNPGQNARYISKNNGNIARLDLLADMFPRAEILIVLRDPFEHAASMHRQHLRFCSMQADDPFVQNYMSDIGHHEFGNVHKPFDFPSFDTLVTERFPSKQDVNYWAAYWIACFSWVVDHLPKNSVVLPYEQLCQPDSPLVGALFNRLGLEMPERDDLADLIKAPKYSADRSRFDPCMQTQMRDLHDALLQKSCLI